MTMEMAGKTIVCLVVLCMVVVAPHAEAALSCNQIRNGLNPCVPYLQGRGPLGSCCGVIKGVLSATKTPADHKACCLCVKSAIKSVTGIDAGKAAGLPAVCGVNIPYKISPSVDCSKIQ